MSIHSLAVSLCTRATEPVIHECYGCCNIGTIELSRDGDLHSCPECYQAFLDEEHEAALQEKCRWCGCEFILHDKLTGPLGDKKKYCCGLQKHRKTGELVDCECDRFECDE